VLVRTQEEVEQGNALGLYTEADLDLRFARLWHPCRRVGLLQGDTVRPIDDFSEFGHNGNSATNDQITLGEVDEVCSLMKAWTEAASDDGRVNVTLSSGPLWRDVRQRVPEQGA